MGELVVAVWLSKNNSVIYIPRLLLLILSRAREICVETSQVLHLEVEVSVTFSVGHDSIYVSRRHLIYQDVGHLTGLLSHVESLKRNHDVSLFLNKGRKNGLLDSVVPNERRTSGDLLEFN